MNVDVEADRHDDHVIVHWSTPRSSGSCRFDHLPGTHPEWLGAGDELLEGADRREERAVLGAIAAWAAGEQLELGLWHDDQGIELLV
ncbi:MAG: hypothetical protein U5K30_09240 [Acidimicrobiales bacterium]|nr:hypothetical protein [Acidimicrobiales bacterium]